LFILAPVLKVYETILNKIIDNSSFFLVYIFFEQQYVVVKKVSNYNVFLAIKKALK